jgi:hypothetical protein
MLCFMLVCASLNIFSSNLSLSHMYVFILWHNATSESESESERGALHSLHLYL